MHLLGFVTMTLMATLEGTRVTSSGTWYTTTSLWTQNCFHVQLMMHTQCVIYNLHLLVVRVDTNSLPVCAGVFARVIMFRHHCQNAHLCFPDHWPWLLAAVPILPGRRHHWPCLHLVTPLGAASTAASHSIKVILPINYVYVRCFGDYQQVRENSFEFLFFRWFRYNSTSVIVV